MSRYDDFHGDEPEVDQTWEEYDRQQCQQADIDNDDRWCELND